MVVGGLVVVGKVVVVVGGRVLVVVVGRISFSQSVPLKNIEHTHVNALMSVSSCTHKPSFRHGDEWHAVKISQFSPITAPNWSEH